MDNTNTEIINGANPSIIWTQYMDCLSQYGKYMKSIYTKRMRVNKPITWSELDVINKQIHDKLDYLMTWDEKFNQTNDNSTQPQLNQQDNQTQQQSQTESHKRKNKVRLSESDLHRIIKEAVVGVLNEIGDTKHGQFALNAVRGRAHARPAYHNDKYGSVPNRAKQQRIASMAADEAWENKKEKGEVGNSEWNNYANSGYYYGFQKGVEG
jgi:hypothetical protein